jgi:hypothetical protein
MPGRLVAARTKTPRRASSPSSSVRSVDNARRRLGERFVASWNECVELVEEDNAWRGGARPRKYLTDRALTLADVLHQAMATKSNISYFDFRDGTRKSAHLIE